MRAHKTTIVSRITWLLAAFLFYATSASAGPFGTGGVRYMKYISDAPGMKGAKFWAIQCKKGTPLEVLFEPNGTSSGKWFLIPASDTPEKFYTGTSASAFAALACANEASAKTSVSRITGGVGATASGAKSYEITCSNGVTYSLMDYAASGGTWVLFDTNTSFDLYRGLPVKDFASKFCASR